MIFPHIMQGKMSLNLVIVMMGQVMGWQCKFCPAMCMQCEGIYRKPSHAIDNSQCECEREPCLKEGDKGYQSPKGDLGPDTIQ